MTFRVVRETHPVAELSADSRWTWKTWIPQASFNPLRSIAHKRKVSYLLTCIKTLTYWRHTVHLIALDALRSRVAHWSNTSLLESDISM